MEEKNDAVGIWYFAYGSNINEHVFFKRRKIQATEINNARLDNYCLEFTMPGFPIFEQCFANIAPCPEQSVYGVAYLLTPQLIDQVVKTEGPLYELVDIELGLDDGTLVPAKTLLYHYEIAQHHRRPSKRYMSLIIAGAQAHDFPKDYIQQLKSQPINHTPVLSDVFAWCMNIAIGVLLYWKTRGLRA